MKRIFQTAFFVAAAGTVVLPSSCAPEPAPAVDQLIRQLGSDDFEEREAAGKALDALGEPAIRPLLRSLRGGDLEVRTRARALVRSIASRTWPDPAAAVEKMGGKTQVKVFDDWDKKKSKLPPPDRKVERAVVDVIFRDVPP